ncbi:hypothetical protein, partial [Aeromonas caviae]|uniref:hypothetical protein n=1 Tax=Aeromonas caviae TaxID=648 RepID=UPI000651DA41
MFANLNRVTRDNYRVAAISLEPGKRTVVVALPFALRDHRVAAISSEPGKRTVVVALPFALRDHRVAAISSE